MAANKFLFIKSIRLSSKHLLTLLTILIFCFSLITKLYHLDERSFDFDEVWTAKFSRHPYIHILAGIRYDPGNPPAYFLFIKVWKLIRENDLWLRLPSVFFHMLTIWLIYKQIKTKLQPTSTLLVLILLSTSSIIFFLSRYARAYSLLLLICIAAFPLLNKIISSPKTNIKTKIITYGVCLFGLYSHYSFVIFYVFSFLTYLFINITKKMRLKRLLIFSFYLLLGYLPWVTIFLSSQLPSMGYRRYGFNQIHETWVGFEGWLSIFTNQLSEVITSRHHQALFGIILLIVFDYLLIRCFASLKNNWKKTIILFFLISFNFLMLTPFHKIFNNPRYSIYILPFAFMSLAVLLESQKNKLITYFSTLVVTAFGALTFYHYEPAVSEDWKGLSKKLPTGEINSAILLEPCHLGFTLDYYYHGIIPQFCFYKNDEGMYLPTWNGTRYNKLHILFYHWDDKFDYSKLNQLQTDYTSSSTMHGNIELVTLTKKVKINPWKN